MSLPAPTLRERTRVNKDKKKVTWKEAIQAERGSARPQSLSFPWRESWRNRKGKQMKTGRMKETKGTKEEQRPLLSQASLNSKKGVCQNDNLVVKEQNLPVPLPVNFQAGCEGQLKDLHLDAKVKTRSSLRWDQWTRRQLLGRGAVP